MINWTGPDLLAPSVIIPVSKVGKIPKLTTSHRPIALTSYLAKLVKRLVFARIAYMTGHDGLVPPEQVGFRRGRPADWGRPDQTGAVGPGRLKQAETEKPTDRGQNSREDCPPRL